MSTTRWMWFSMVAVLGVACGSRIEVRTMAAPDAGLGALQTFRPPSGATTSRSRARTTR